MNVDGNEPITREGTRPTSLTASGLQAELNKPFNKKPHMFHEKTPHRVKTVNLTNHQKRCYQMRTSHPHKTKSGHQTAPVGKKRRRQTDQIQRRPKDPSGKSSPYFITFLRSKARRHFCGEPKRDDWRLYTERPNGQCYAKLSFDR